MFTCLEVTKANSGLDKLSLDNHLVYSSLGVPFISVFVVNPFICPFCVLL